MMKNWLKPLVMDHRNWGIFIVAVALILLSLHQSAVIGSSSKRTRRFIGAGAAVASAVALLIVALRFYVQPS